MSDSYVEVANAVNERLTIKNFFEKSFLLQIIKLFTFAAQR